MQEIQISMREIQGKSKMRFIFQHSILLRSTFYFARSDQPAWGGGQGMGWGFDIFKNLPSNSLPTGKSFQSNATKFPHPGIAIEYPKGRTQERHNENISKYPLPWENKISQMPHPRANKDNQNPTPCSPAGITLIGA